LIWLGQGHAGTEQDRRTEEPGSHGCLGLNQRLESAVDSFAGNGQQYNRIWASRERQRPEQRCVPPVADAPCSQATGETPWATRAASPWSLAPAPASAAPSPCASRGPG